MPDNHELGEPGKPTKSSKKQPAVSEITSDGSLKSEIARGCCLVIRALKLIKSSAAFKCSMKRLSLIITGLWHRSERGGMGLRNEISIATCRAGYLNERAKNQVLLAECLFSTASGAFVVSDGSTVANEFTATPQALACNAAKLFKLAQLLEIR